jgi:ribosomal protein S8
MKEKEKLIHNSKIKREYAKLLKREGYSEPVKVCTILASPSKSVVPTYLHFCSTPLNC